MIMFNIESTKNIHPINNYEKFKKEDTKTEKKETFA